MTAQPTETTFHSDARPDFEPFEASCGRIVGFRYAGDLASELEAGSIDVDEAVRLVDGMLAIRELEEMIVRLRSGGYDALPGYDYRGPTHVSIGQEATSIRPWSRSLRTARGPIAMRRRLSTSPGW